MRSQERVKEPRLHFGENREGLQNGDELEQRISCQQFRNACKRGNQAQRIGLDVVLGHQAMGKCCRDASAEALADDADVLRGGTGAHNVVPYGPRILDQPLFRWREDACG